MVRRYRSRSLFLLCLGFEWLLFVSDLNLGGRVALKVVCKSLMLKLVNLAI